LETKNKIKIPFVGTKEGVHEFKIQLNKSFIDEFVVDSAIERADIKVSIALHKMKTVSHLDITVKGSLFLPCDRCLETTEVAVNISETAYIKVRGESENEDDDNILYINPNESDVDCSHFVYECLILSIPLRVIHAESGRGQKCNPEILKLFTTNSTQTNSNKNDIDSRWEQLKNIQ